MTRGVRLYLVGSLVLVVLAGCGRSWLAEREPWRREAEVACLRSGSLKTGSALVQISPISGPGVCGADFPIKVTALGESAAIGYADELRPPGSVPGGSPRYALPPVVTSGPQRPAAYPSYPPQPYPPAVSPAGAPLSLHPPGMPDADDEADDDGPPRQPQRAAPSGPPPAPYGAPPPLPALGPQRGPAATAAIAPVEIKPVATLACPVVSALDSWLVQSVQPAALRWFGAPVAEIKQISAYSCRGMNGQRGAPISEHAFGNALDIAAFTLADGRRITVKDGWRGLPEEQGFLREIQGSACDRFSTVLAPGSNVFHYDHIHVDLARRASGRVACNPRALGADVIAQRYGAGAVAGRRDLSGPPARTAARPAPRDDDDEAPRSDPWTRGTDPFAARRGDPGVTGSIGKPKQARRPRSLGFADEAERMERYDEKLPRAVAGED